jgi:hypothetical protein
MVEPIGWSLPGYGFGQDAVTRQHARLLLHEINRGRLDRLPTWFETLQDREEHWIAASTETDGRLITHQCGAGPADRGPPRCPCTLHRARAEPGHTPPDAARVEVQFYAFPTRLEATEHEGP